MTSQQPQTINSDINAVVANENGGLVRLLEEPMWQAIFASVTTISLFGFVVSGIWMVDAVLK